MMAPLPNNHIVHYDNVYRRAQKRIHSSSIICEWDEEGEEEEKVVNYT